MVKVGPLVISTIGSMVMGFTSLLVGLAPMGGVVLAGIGKLFDMIAGMTPQEIQLLTAAIIGLCVGMKLYRAVTDLATNAGARFTQIMEASPIVKVILILAALGAAVYVLYGRYEGFRNVVDKAWSGIQAASAIAWEQYIQPAFKAIAAYINDTLIPAWRDHLWPAIQVAWAY